MDLIFEPEVQEIFDHFSSLFGIRIAFFTPDGQEVRIGLRLPICSYCTLLKEELAYDPLCRELDRRRREEARESGELIVYVCHAGMTEAVIPLFYEATLIGYVMIGQFRTGPNASLPAALRAKCRRAGIAGDAREAFEKTRLVTPDQRDHILSILKYLSDLIVSKRMIQPRDPTTLVSLISYMQEHMDEPLSLTQAAKLFHRSPSTISRAFRRGYGRSFKQVQTEIRLNRAEQLLRSAPGITVREVAYELGYDDPLYFSRVFRKYRGVPPSRLLQKSRGQGRPRRKKELPLHAPPI